MASTIVPLSEIPTLSLLYRLQHLDPAIANNYKPSSNLNSLISFIRKDITTLEVSTIVNAANNSLLGGGGVDGAIHRAAGPQLVEECEKLHGCATGSAKITSAYELPCDKVIHAVGPIYWEAKKTKPGLEKELLRSCYRTSLDLAAQNGCKSIAFSALSTGVYGYPSGEAAKEAIGEVRDWVDENWKPDGSLERIVFVVFEMKDVRAYNQWLPVYFPATAEDLPHVKEDSKHDEMINEMPDPPTAEPTEEGTPEVKKQKIESEKTDDEWEAIEKPEGYAENGLHDAKSKSSEEINKEAVPTTSPHIVAVGSEEVENRLGKDW